MIRVWDQAFAQAVDFISTSELKIPSPVLMERAGLAVADFVLGLKQSYDRVIILAGVGNNGGDGLVVARELASRQIPTSTYIVSRLPTKYSEACRLQREILSAIGHPIEIYQFGCLQKFLKQKVLIVDAILGVGFKTPLEDGPLRDALREAAALPHRTVVAVDMPSGLAADSWNDEVVLKADYTVTFGETKPCHVVEPSRKFCGKVTVANPGFPTAALQRATTKCQPHLLQSRTCYQQPFSQLPKDANKYDRGHVLVMGGSEGKYGAPILTGLAAARSGAGWITIVVNANDISTSVEPHYPELTFEQLTLSNFSQLADFVRNRKVRCIVFGPGWIDQQFEQASIQDLITLQRSTALNIVFDAGATKSLEALIDGQSFDPQRTIATPHPGEWSRMFSHIQPLANITDLDRVGAICKALGMTVIYKGASPIIIAPDCWDGVPSVICAGSNIVAKAGAGDVLDGVIAAHSIQSQHIGHAACSALHHFYRAGDIASVSRGQHGVMPSDLLNSLGIA